MRELSGASAGPKYRLVLEHAHVIIVQRFQESNFGLVLMTAVAVKSSKFRDVT